MNAIEILEFPTEPFEVAAAPPESDSTLPKELIKEEAIAATQSLQELHSQRFDGYYRWGLNE
jgi:hypothetical protein